MPKVTVYNQTGSQVGEIELAEAIFGIEPNEAVLFESCNDATCIFTSRYTQSKNSL